MSSLHKTIVALLCLVTLQLSMCTRGEAVAPNPGIDSVISPGRCGTGKVTLKAIAHNAKDTIRWYLKPTGGAAIGTGEAWTTPSISSSTIYYVGASKTSKRKPVTATVNPLPATPTIFQSGTLCEGGSIFLKISPTSNPIQWSTGATTTSISVYNPGTYTVRVSNSSGCSVSASATITRTKTPHILSISPGMRDGHGQMLLSAKSDAGSVRWFTSDTAVKAISYGTLYFTPTLITPGTYTYYADAIDNGCVSTRIAIPATVKPLPGKNAHDSTETSMKINADPKNKSLTMTGSSDMIYIITNESKSTVAEGKLNETNNHTAEVKDLPNGEFSFIGYNNKKALVREKIVVKK